jgi:PII-like signaling protein
MRPEDVQVLLRVYLRNTDKYRWLSATDTLVERARRHGVAGATVVQGIFGVDGAGELLEARPWAIVQPAPIVVEFVDEPEVLSSFLPVVSQVAPKALMTAQVAYARFYRRRPRATAAVAGHPRIPTSLDMPPWLDWPERSLTAELGEAGQLLQVFTRGTDTYRDEPLFRATVLRARELGMIWAAVFQGVIGYGAAGCLRAARIFGPLAELPLVIEVVDRGKNVQRLLPFLDAAMDEGMVTLEDVVLAAV